MPPDLATWSMAARSRPTVKLAAIIFSDKETGDGPDREVVQGGEDAGVGEDRVVGAGLDGDPAGRVPST